MGLPLLTDINERISQVLDVPYSQINFLICMLLTFPIGYLNRKITCATKRLFYGLITGMLLQFQMFGLAFLHIVIATLNTYLFIKYLGRKYSSFYIILFNILHLSYLHIKVMLDSYSEWSLGIEACYMLSICKFSSIAFNYEDGGKDESTLKTYFKMNIIKERPTLLETFSYIFFFPTALVGPSFEYSDFIRFIKLEKEYKDINYKACNKSALENMFWVVVFLLVVVKFTKVTDPYFCTTPEYANLSLVYKLLYVYFSIIVLRSKYYLAWKLGQASIDFCGLGYTLKQTEDGKQIISFDKIDACNLTKMEGSINPRVRIQYWNRSVHLWLKNYLYMRIINSEKFAKNKGIASFLTFGYSALWHGFYPSYYLFFFQYFLIEQISVFLEENYDFFNQIEKKSLFFRILINQLGLITLKYFGQTFAILSVEGVFNYYKSFNFIPNILLIIIFVYVTFILKKKRKTN